LFDTGSYNFFLPSINCFSSACQDKNKYDSSKSSTYQPDGKPITLSYNGGEVRGIISSDNIILGGI